MSNPIQSSEQFFASASTLRTKDVELPNGQIVRVRGLTVAERGRMDASIQSRKGQREAWEKYRPRLVYMCALNADNERLFTDAGDLARLMSMDAGMVEPMVNAILDLSETTDKDVDELAGNFDATGSGSSSSDSRKLRATGT
jgi:hypothetical protein